MFSRLREESLANVIGGPSKCGVESSQTQSLTQDPSWSSRISANRASHPRCCVLMRPVFGRMKSTRGEKNNPSLYLQICTHLSKRSLLLIVVQTEYKVRGVTVTDKNLILFQSPFLGVNWDFWKVGELLWASKIHSGIVIVPSGPEALIMLKMMLGSGAHVYT